MADLEESQESTSAAPVGRRAFVLFLNHGHAVMKYRKNQKLAKDLIRWLHKIYEA